MVVGAKPRKLLMIACSQSKHSDAGLLPAIERYDGPVFRLLRRFLRQQCALQPDIYILSAEFGLIHYAQPILNYDRRMTRSRAQELQPKIIDDLGHLLSSKPYQELLICVGRDYFFALNGYEALISEGLAVQVAKGASGQKLSELYQWLYGKPPAPSSNRSIATYQGKARLRGIEMVLTPMQVIEVARCAILEGKDDPTRYKSWYVLVDGQRVSPKWLVSQLTGLPVKEFRAEEARIVLGKLGIEVLQVTETVNEG